MLNLLRLKSTINNWRLRVKTRVIAEVGDNWKKLGDLTDSIMMAAKAGCWAVKFQSFSESDLYGFGKDARKVDPKYFGALKAAADNFGIEFMCTVFHPDAVKLLDPWVKYHKVASSDVTDLGLLKAINECGKPVFLSTGASSRDEIATALDCLPDCHVTLLYCHSAYPAKQHDLRMIDVLREEFKLPVGYSDHSIDIYSPWSAAHHYGAEVIEKHVNFCGASSADSGHSIDYGNLLQLVHRLKHSPTGYSWMPGELDMRLMHNKRWVAIKTIQKGKPLKVGDNVGIYRTKTPSAGGEPLTSEDIGGKLAAKRIGKGEPITYEKIQGS